eukprot:COSAG03_NODE_18645_length_348_cov_0.615079_1_plen_96_part_01
MVFSERSSDDRHHRNSRVIEESFELRLGHLGICVSDRDCAAVLASMVQVFALTSAQTALGQVSQLCFRSCQSEQVDEWERMGPRHIELSSYLSNV